MDFIIRPNSHIPIYEQICEGIRQNIKNEKLQENDPLPSIRSLAKDYKISALTVKKAYDQLEQEGLIITVQGKGSFVAAVSSSMVQEEMQRQTEKLFEQAIEKARQAGLNDDQILETVQLLLEES